MKDNCYIAANSEPISKKELAEMIARYIGYDGRILYDESMGITPSVNAVPKRLNAEGWKAKIPLGEGIKDMIKYLETEVSG